MAEITTALVAVEQKLWEGSATSVVAATTEGEIGVLPGHQPFFGQLAEDGVVTIKTAEGETLVAAVTGGFLSVTKEKITVLADFATLVEDIDKAAAEAALESADPIEAACAKAQLHALRVANA